MDRKGAGATAMKWIQSLGIGMGLVGSIVGCSSNEAGTLEVEQLGSNVPRLSFAEFKAKTHRDPSGVYVVDGDTPISNEKKLREFYDSLFAPGKLAVQEKGGADVVWSSKQAINITYCISEEFKDKKDAVVKAMADAGGAWEGIANVKFVHVEKEDAKCTADNENVVFDVSSIQDQPYLARAFFPDQSRDTRNVLIDSSAFDPSSGWSLTGILRHELGHTLGFRHEHTRPEAGRCFEDNDWRALTPYDKKSVMHYPQCNGTDSGLVLTASDAEGAQSLYGKPGEGPKEPTDPTPNPTPSDKEEKFSGSVKQGESQAYGPFAVTKHFNARLSGKGDADLYVGFGKAPTLSKYACRPFEDTSKEVCDLDVPRGQKEAYVMVRGAGFATYDLVVTYE